MCECIQQQKGETPMIRKTVLAVATAAVVGLAALAPTAALAGKGGKHHHHHRHGGWGTFVITTDDDDCGWRYFRRYGKLYKVWSCD
jgi:hypothetical protein